MSNDMNINNAELGQSIRDWHAEQRAKLRYTPEHLSKPWKSVSEELPPEGRFVLIRLTKDNWGHKDQGGVYFRVACLERGISMEDRGKMERGEIPDPLESGYVGERWTACVYRRSRSFTGADEHGNNKVPWCWMEGGGDKYWGQEVDYWMEIPRS